MDDDLRCCGSGTCLINAEGLCWCGQHWDGSQMRPPRPDIGAQVCVKPADSQPPSALPG